ncbi:MAG: tRNA (guanine(10)-N(2))-dimethyltransferase [Candidatus Bathyarchaeia archaeon]
MCKFEVELLRGLVESKEGLVRLLLTPQALKPLAERKPKPRVFYNPEASLNRDVAVLAVRVFSRRKGGDLRVCDPLAGCGVRGIRFLAEGVGVKEAIINDLNSDAVEFIRVNLEANGLSEKAKVFNLDARELLLRRDIRQDGFDLVDIDPFGSPAPFIQPALLSLKRGGILAVTATDTAPLSGRYPRTCLRRYWSKPLKTEYYPEVAIRILLGFIARNCTMLNRGLKPLFAHRTTQYIRVYIETIRGTTAADKTLDKIGYLNHCFNCFYRRFTVLEEETANSCPNCGNRFEWAGPLWIGEIFNVEFCSQMVAEYKNSHLTGNKNLGRLIEIIASESSGDVTYYVIDELTSLLKVSSPSKNMVLKKLREMGYNAFPTHFNGKGFRTNAPLKEILNGLSDITRSLKPTL